MLPILNRYSYLITSAAAMAAAWAIGARIGGPAAPIAVAGVGTALALVQRRLRGGASSVPSWAAVQHAMGQGVPLLLFIYSDT